MRQPAARWYRPLLPIVALVFTAACGVTQKPILYPAPAHLPTAAELTSSLTQRREQLHSLRALARLRYTDPKESNSSRQALIVERPGRVRVEVLSLMGAAFLLTADDTTLVAYVPGERTVYRGTASPENLWRYTRLWMPVRDLVDVVLGTPDVSADATGNVTFEPESGRIRLQHIADEGEAAVWFSTDGLPVAAERRSRNGVVLWQTRYGGYEAHDGITVATQIALELPRFSRTMELSLAEIELNPKLDSRLFALQPPQGSQVVNLDQVVD